MTSPCAPPPPQMSRELVTKRLDVQSAPRDLKRLSDAIMNMDNVSQGPSRDAADAASAPSDARAPDPPIKFKSAPSSGTQAKKLQLPGAHVDEVPARRNGAPARQVPANGSSSGAGGLARGSRSGDRGSNGTVKKRKLGRASKSPSPSEIADLIAGRSTRR